MNVIFNGCLKNIKVMKKVILKTGIIFLIMLLAGAGCDNDKQYIHCYEGEVVSVNQGNGCDYIIKILKTPNNHELPIGTTLAFDPELYKEELNMGDIVYFNIIQYEDWVGPATANCLWPKYAAQIKFCNN